MLVADASLLGPSPVEPMIGLFQRVPSGEKPKRLVHQPQAFRVTVSPEGQTRVHYHPVDQFQIFVAGDGRLGQHEVHSECLHYSDAFQPYGPLTAGGGGFSYLTLRAWSDSGAWFMPESREELASSRSERPRRRPRNLSLDLYDVSAPHEWMWLVDEADELRVGVYELGVPGPVNLPVAGGDGAFLVVLRGDLTLDGKNMSPSSVAFLRRDESSGACRTTAGSKLCWLQLPLVDPAAAAGEPGA